MMRFSMQHSVFTESPPVEFDESDAPDWLTGRSTILGSTADMRWFWQKHVLTLEVGQSIDTDFQTITRIL